MSWLRSCPSTKRFIPVPPNPEREYQIRRFHTGWPLSRIGGCDRSNCEVRWKGDLLTLLDCNLALPRPLLPSAHRSVNRRHSVGQLLAQPLLFFGAQL